MESKIPVFKEIEEKELKTKDKNGYNFLLEGDNLHSLYLLEKTHKGNIDVIYIDPPYNTGNNDFMYDDKFVDKEDAYIHLKWISFMDKRLRIAQKLFGSMSILWTKI